MNPDFMYYSHRFQMTGSLGDVYRTLAGLNSPELRYAYVRDLLKEHGMLPTELVRPCKEGLYDKVSMELERRTGNRCFNRRDYVSALFSYMKCVLGTEPGTVQHAYALANRSATYFHLKRYELCLADIRRSIASMYPVQLLYKLYERAGHAEFNLGRGESAILHYNACLEHLDNAILTPKQKSGYSSLIAVSIKKCNGLEEKEVPVDKQPVEKLSHGSHSVIPGLSKLVKLQCSPTMGRGVFALEDISPGDVVAVDEPYISGSSPLNSQLCHYDKCLIVTCSIIPCPNCKLIYYCSEECMQMASESGHKLECPIIVSIKSLPGDNKLNQLAFRWFVSELLKWNLNDYYVLVKKLLETNKEPMVRGFSDSNVYASNNFVTAFTMQFNEYKTSMDLLLFYYCIGVEMMEYLQLSIEIPDYYLNTVGASLVHMLIVTDTYCRKLTVLSPCIPAEVTKHKFIPLAYSLYPTIHLFNHSCDPNVRRSGVLCDRIRVMKAVQPIPKGSQLLISYGPDFKMENKETRASELSDLFRFNCECHACVENWPSYRFLPIRLTSLNLLNVNEAGIVQQECKKFTELTASESFVQAPHLHLTYLYDFLKLLFRNVKRPFKLYEDCVSWISIAHITINHGNTEFTDIIQTF